MRGAILILCAVRRPSFDVVAVHKCTQATSSTVQDEIHSYVKYYQASEPAPVSFSEGHEKVMVPGESELYYESERTAKVRATCMVAWRAVRGCVRACVCACVHVCMHVHVYLSVILHGCAMQGIPIDANTWTQLSELGESSGVAVPE